MSNGNANHRPLGGSAQYGQPMKKRNQLPAPGAIRRGMSTEQVTVPPTAEELNRHTAVNEITGDRGDTELAYPIRDIPLKPISPFLHGSTTAPLRIAANTYTWDFQRKATESHKRNVMAAQGVEFRTPDEIALDRARDLDRLTKTKPRLTNHGRMGSWPTATSTFVPGVEDIDLLPHFRQLKRLRPPIAHEFKDGTCPNYDLLVGDILPGHIQHAVTVRHFFNRPLRVIYRSGFSITLPAWADVPQPTARNVIWADQTFDWDRPVSLHRESLSDIGGTKPLASTTSMLKALDAHENHVNSGSVYVRRVAMRFTLTEAELTAGHGTLYLKDLDIVITEHVHDFSIVHPHSANGEIFRSGETQVSFQFRVDINDPDSKFGERWLNLNGHVELIRPIRDPNRAPGVYVYAGHPCDSLYDDGVLWEPKYYTFAELDKLDVSLYMTEVEARNSTKLEASEKLKLDLQLAQLKQDSLNKQQEIANTAHAHRLVTGEMDLKLAQLKHAHELERAEMARKLQIANEEVAERDRVAAVEKLRREQEYLAEKRAMEMRHEEVTHRREQAFANEKAQREREITEEKIVRDRLAMEDKARRESAQAEERWQYESKAANRKDTSNMFSWILSSVSVVINIVLIVLKVKQKA